MSSMAKIFVVVNVVLAVVAFGSAATLLGAQDDYKTALEDVRAAFDQYKGHQDTLLDDRERDLALQQNRAGEAVGRANTLESSNQDLEGRLAKAATRNDQLQATAETLAQEVKQANTINQNNKDWLEKLAADSKTATEQMLNARTQLREEIANRVQLETTVSNQNTTIADLSAEKGDLEKQLRQLNFWLAEYRKRYGDMTNISKGSEGRINSVRDDLVVISVGSADGVQVGDVYHIRRGATYVGQVVIDKVEKNLSVGTFDSRFPGPGAPPQRGDVAYPGSR
ncbi:MAG: MreC domain-containing protein [Planctomycetota bacterium]|jgi:chromosome segregation ATPase